MAYLPTPALMMSFSLLAFSMRSPVDASSKTQIESVRHEFVETNQVFLVRLRNCTGAGMPCT